MEQITRAVLLVEQNIPRIMYAQATGSSDGSEEFLSRGHFIGGEDLLNLLHDYTATINYINTIYNRHEIIVDVKNNSSRSLVTHGYLTNGGFEALRELRTAAETYKDLEQQVEKNETNVEDTTLGDVRDVDLDLSLIHI